jgi:hypothetical protein
MAAQRSGGMSQKGGSATVAGPHRRSTATRASPWRRTTALMKWVVPRQARPMSLGSAQVR